MMHLHLTKGQMALVDNEDHAVLKKYNWHFQGKYACRYDKTVPSKRVYLHRQIMNAPAGKFVDHINGNPLDCRKENMRLCSPSQNNFNALGKSHSRYSKFKGVSFNKQRGLWRASITANKQTYFLGDYEEEIYAVIAYGAAAKVLQGEFAKPLAFDPLNSSSPNSL